jgi:hypothetical protein
MAFAYSAAVAGAGTVSCASSTTVTGVGTNFAFSLGAGATSTQARVGGTITVGGNTRTIVAIASATSLTVDVAFGTFSAQAFTVQTEIIQTGTDTMNLSLGSATGILITNRQDLYRTFDVRGCDFTVNGTLTVDSTVAQLRNDGSCSNRFTVNGSASGGEIIFNGRRANAGNGPFPYFGFDWLGNNGNKIMRLASTNASFPAKFTMIDSAVRFGSDWLTTDSGNFSRIITQGDECWIFCARGTGTSQARIRQDNTTATIDFQAVQTWVGVWLNFGVPQLSLKGYTPINTDGPEINLASVPTASRITIDNFNTTHVVANYYAGVQIVLLGSAWTRLKNNLLGTNISWRSSSSSGGRHNVIEFSKQITIKAQDTAGNLLSDGFMYYQPVGSNVAGVRAKGITSDITFDLTQQNIATVEGSASSEFVFAWAFTTATVNLSAYSYFCTGQTRGAETHSIGSSRYGYDKQYATVNLAGNNDATPTYVHTSLPTSDKVIATAQAITGVAFNFATKVMTITGNLTYQQIYDAYQYALNISANLFQADNCLTINSTSNYVGWTINVGTGVTVSQGSGNFTKLQAQTITLTGTAQITGVYQDSTGTSTVLEISGFDAGSAVYVEDNSEVQKFYSASASGTVTVYIPPTGTGSWYYAVEKYGNQRQSDFFTFSGGLKSMVVKALPDTGLTQSNVSTVSAYTALETPDKIYDYVAYLRLSLPHIGYGQITFKNGQSLDLENASMVVNQSASNVASFNYTSKVLTIKSTSLANGTTYNKIITAPPATVIANTNEVITVEIEDANGDSSINIQGGSGSFSIFKFPIATTAYPSGGDDDRISPTNLITSTAGNGKFRFISDPLYNYMVYDNTQGNKSNIPKEDKINEEWFEISKGAYTAGLYQGEDQIALAQVNEVYDILARVNNLLLDTEAIKGTGFTKDVHSLVNIEAEFENVPTPGEIWSNPERTLTSAGASGATLSEIEGSLILAKKAQIDALGTPLQESTYVAPDNAIIGQIKTKVDTLDNYDDTSIQGKVDALGSPLQEGSYVAPDNTTIGEIKAKVDTLENYNDISLQGKVDSIEAKVDTLENYDDTSLQAKVDGTLKAVDYVEPDNAAISEINTKVDALPSKTEIVAGIRTDLTPELSRIDTNIGSRASLDDLAIVDDKIDQIPTNTLLSNDSRLDNLDAEISSRSTLSLEEVEASTILAKEESIDQIGSDIGDIPATVWTHDNRTLNGDVVE